MQLSSPMGEGLIRGREDRRTLPHSVQWVVKISKLCNLRCNYCYEYKSLGDSHRIGLDQIRRMFEHIARAYEGSRRQMDFVWHGGEPLLIEPAYYEEIFKIQKEIFVLAGIDFSNSIQTNLTQLTDDIESLLKRHMRHVGVSLDLFGSERVTAGGRRMEDQVVANIHRLREAGINLGCITVLSRATVEHIHEIYGFFEACKLSFRLLPIYRTSYPGQQERHALSSAEIRDAFIQAADLWFASESDIQVRPIRDYVINAVRLLHIDKVDLHFYDRREAEIVFIVDTDGQLFSNADAYDPRLSHGDIFEQEFKVMRSSEGYLRSVAGSDGRMAATCKACMFHGACSGYFMGEATPEQRHEENGRLVCSVAKPVQEYVLERLREPILYQALISRCAMSDFALNHTVADV